MSHPNQMQVTLSFDREAMAQAGITEETILMVIKRGLSARIGEFEGERKGISRSCSLGEN